MTNMSANDILLLYVEGSIGCGKTTLCDSVQNLPFLQIGVEPIDTRFIRYGSTDINLLDLASKSDRLSNTQAQSLNVYIYSL